MKLLLVEDNIELAKDILKFLSENGFVAEHAISLFEASDKISVYQYDLVILDIGLPDGSGLDLLPELKNAEHNTGVLVLTAKNAVEDKVRGLELGADDYLTKPFHRAELIARVRSIIRRFKFNGDNTISMNEVRVDILASQAFINDTPVILTKKEYDLLLYFLYNRNRVLTRESIAEHLWGDNIDQSDNFDFVYNHIKNLRKKMMNEGCRNYIKAVYGMGYKFSDH
ncbi:response regulator transcription factor [Bacteroidota bacterium]